MSFFFAKLWCSSIVILIYILVTNYRILSVCSQSEDVNYSKSEKFKIEDFSATYVCEIYSLYFCFVREIDLFIIQKVRHLLHLVAVKILNKIFIKILILIFFYIFVASWIFVLKSSCLLHLLRLFQLSSWFVQLSTSQSTIFFESSIDRRDMREIVASKRNLQREENNVTSVFRRHRRKAERNTWLEFWHSQTLHTYFDLHLYIFFL